MAIASGEISSEKNHSLIPDWLEQGAQYVAGATMLGTVAAAVATKTTHVTKFIAPTFLADTHKLFASRIGKAAHHSTVGGLGMMAMGMIAYKTAERLLNNDPNVDYIRDGSLVAGSVIGALTLVAHRMHTSVRFQMALGALGIAVNLFDAGYVCTQWRNPESGVTATQALFQVGMVGLFSFGKGQRDAFKVMWENRPAARLAKVDAVKTRVMEKIAGVTRPIDAEIARLKLRKNGDATLNAALDSQIAEQRLLRSRGIHRLEFALADVEISAHSTWEGDSILRSNPKIKRVDVPSMDAVVRVHEDHAKYLLLGANGTGGVPLPKHLRGFALLTHGAGASFSSADCHVASGLMDRFHREGVIAIAMDHPYHGYGSRDRNFWNAEKYFSSVEGAYDKLAHRFGTKGILMGRSFGANEVIQIAYRRPDLPVVVAMSPYANEKGGESWVLGNFGQFTKWTLAGKSSINPSGFAWSIAMDNAMPVFRNPAASIGLPHAPIRIPVGSQDMEYLSVNPEYAKYWDDWAAGRGAVEVFHNPGAGHDHFLAQDSTHEATVAADKWLARLIDDHLPLHPELRLERLETAFERLHSRARNAEALGGKLARATEREGNPGIPALKKQLEKARLSDDEVAQYAALGREVKTLKAQLTAATEPSAHVLQMPVHNAPAADAVHASATPAVIRSVAPKTPSSVTGAAS